MGKDADIDRPQDICDVRTFEHLTRYVQAYPCVITYKSTFFEVDPSALLLSITSKLSYTVPPSADSIPGDEAAELMHQVGSNAAVILIPGRKFDSSGTRYGKGGGWYDRFLSSMPEK